MMRQSDCRGSRLFAVSISANNPRQMVSVVCTFSSRNLAKRALMQGLCGCSGNNSWLPSVVRAFISQQREINAHECAGYENYVTSRENLLVDTSAFTHRDWINAPAVAGAEPEMQHIWNMVKMQSKSKFKQPTAKK